MKTSTSTILPSRLVLRAETAEELMTSNPVSIREEATVAEAIRLLTDRGFSAAPVIDHAGRPVGVVSRADILVHDRENVDYVAPLPDYYERAEVDAGFERGSAHSVRTGTETVRVRDIMTPVVFAVGPETPACKVVEYLLAWKVHRVFVISQEGVLTGVISVLDILGNLSAPAGTTAEAAGWELER
jgi:CBS-domain-containing membrane protein